MINLLAQLRIDWAKSLKLEAVYLNYPIENRLCVYAVGSVYDDLNGVGAGETCKLLSYYKHVRKLLQICKLS
jgi:hypothetical protein